MHKIPELLVSLSGESIDTIEQWERIRRPEILSLFCEYVYGFRDIERPEDMRFICKEETVFKGMRKKEIHCEINDYSFPFTVYAPLDASAPTPTVIFVMTETPERCYLFDESGNMRGRHDDSVIRDNENCIPVKSITERGFSVVIMPTRNVYPDWKAKAAFKKGVFSSYRPLKPRQGNSWAGISAWSWGVDRVVDYLETDPQIDSGNIAVVGFSRGGKAALWAGATNERIKLTVSVSSGCGGAAIQRGKVGERIKDINVSDWFCENYRRFNENEELLPVDQHMLLALMAPRYVYVTSSELDTWADPKAEYLSCKLASPAYALYGAEGLSQPQALPSLETPSLNGHIAHHMKWGDHSIGAYDWEHILEYFQNIIDGAV